MLSCINVWRPAVYGKLKFVCSLWGERAYVVEYNVEKRLHFIGIRSQRKRPLVHAWHETQRNDGKITRSCCFYGRKSDCGEVGSRGAKFQRAVLIWQEVINLGHRTGARPLSLIVIPRHLIYLIDQESVKSWANWSTVLVIDDSRNIKRKNASCVGYISNVNVQNDAVVLTYT